MPTGSRRSFNERQHLAGIVLRGHPGYGPLDNLKRKNVETPLPAWAPALIGFLWIS
jgi:hypothetical protein